MRKGQALQDNGKSKDLTIYTDGACKGNPGPGGYGAVVIRDGVRRELSGGARRTTNNRMELMALVAALSELEGEFACRLQIYSDSQYLINGFKKGWVAGWKRNGWLTSSREPVQNRDLWVNLDSMLALHRHEFHWVRGHGSNAENNRCDELAVRASQRKPLPPDDGFENPPAPPPQPKGEQPVFVRPSPKRIKPSPVNWDDDLFSPSNTGGAPVNWDL